MKLGTKEKREDFRLNRLLRWKTHLMLAKKKRKAKRNQEIYAHVCSAEKSTRLKMST